MEDLSGGLSSCFPVERCSIYRLETLGFYFQTRLLECYSCAKSSSRPVGRRRLRTSDCEGKIVGGGKGSWDVLRNSGRENARGKKHW